MAVVTDLTWLQLNNALKQTHKTSYNMIYNSDGNNSILLLDLTRLSKLDALNITQLGVLQGIITLMDAARLAQENANTGQSAGEKLNSFSVPSNGVPSNLFVPTTRTIVTRADLRLAKNVVGTNI